MHARKLLQNHKHSLCEGEHTVAEMTRERLDRDIISVETHLGAIPFKVARRGGEVMNASPEFDHCVRIAEKEGVSVKNVQAIAMKAYLDLSN